MKIPLSWLKEFVSIDANVDEICRRLTMAGLEVESVDQLVPTFSDVYVAKVVGVEPHPNADRLRLCDVDAGPVGHFRVVCGAPNARAGMTAALARIGARLAGGVHGEGTGSLEDAVPLQAATIRGVQSEGMLCSELELGLSKDHKGILELNADAKPGEPLATYLRIPDTVIDIAITPNRGDCLSILGVAREVAALFGARLRMPKPKAVRPSSGPQSEGRMTVSVDIQAPDLCPRYAALAMTGIKLGQSPMWMRRRLKLCGMRAVNNVVDATNYVMIELGQPLHAFDMERIAGHSIIVRRAGSEREFETLDGVRRTLDPADLMIADPEKPLALAGIMGGRNSEVSAATTAIILESAYFEPMTIARTSRRMGLRSEASYRFERGIDRSAQVAAVMRVAELIRESAGGREASPVIDIEARPAPHRQIDCDLSEIASILGINVPAPVAKQRLKAIGAMVKAAGRNRFTVLPPPFRPDLNETADLAEEIARLAGLAEIPEMAPARTSLVTPLNPERALVRKLREVMIGCGLVEMRTIAFIAPQDNERFPGFAGGPPVAVTNPLSMELSELRLSLLPGLLAALRFNLNREASALHAFEIGKTFAVRDGAPDEYERMSGLSYGDYAMGAIGRSPIKADFFSIKGILETCFRTLGIAEAVQFESVSSTTAPYLHPGRSAQIMIDGRLLGIVGELHPAESLRLELLGCCVLFELDLRHLLAYGCKSRQVVEAPPRFPAVRRDLALVLDREVPADKVLKTVSGLGSALLESVELFDVYEGGSVAEGKKSVALACRYRGKDRTLTDEEVNRAHAQLVDQAKARLGAELRQ